MEAARAKNSGMLLDVFSLIVKVNERVVLAE